MRFGIFDAIGYLIVAFVLFFPVFWFAIYFALESLRYRKWSSTKVTLEEPSKSEREQDSAVPTIRRAA